jgi:Xaa-Pro aminopeptidase
VNKYGRADTLAAELGGGGDPGDKYYKHQFVGYLVFTDRGGDTIERASLGDNLLPTRGDLKKFVEERDPKRIAVNMSDYLGMADGLSYTGYKALVKDLGEKYAARLISSENLVSDFRAWKVAGEIALFSDSIRLTAQLHERALSNEVIKPGVTTLGDIVFWVADQLIARGYPPKYDMPRILYPNPEMLTTNDSNYVFNIQRKTGPYSRVIQRGDLVGWDTGIQILGSYGTDIERWAYVLREGETDVPKILKEAFDVGVKVRKTCRKLYKPGYTGLETLNLMYSKLKELGYEICSVEDQVSDSPNYEINIGMHGVGEPEGHGAGPKVWTDRDDPFRSELVIKPTNLVAFEFFVYYPLPEWGGKKLLVDFEDDVLITENGVELIVPWIDKINLVR